jgi:hypothetical protein
MKDAYLRENVQIYCIGNVESVSIIRKLSGAKYRCPLPPVPGLVRQYAPVSRR